MKGFDIFKDEGNVLMKNKCSYAFVSLLCAYFDFRSICRFLTMAQIIRIQVSDFRKRFYFQRVNIHNFQKKIADLEMQINVENCSGIFSFSGNRKNRETT